MVLVSHKSSFPGTWFVPFPVESGIAKSIWLTRPDAAAEQTKDAPLGLHASDRILKQKTPSAGVGCTERQWGHMEKQTFPTLISFAKASRWSRGGIPGHVFINANFAKVLFGFCVIKANSSNATAQQQLKSTQRKRRENKCHTPNKKEEIKRGLPELNSGHILIERILFCVPTLKYIVSRSKGKSTRFMETALTALNSHRKGNSACMHHQKNQIMHFKQQAGDIICSDDSI